MSKVTEYTNADRRAEHARRGDLDKFYTKRGCLTAYAMACGYIYSCEWEDGCRRISLNSGAVGDGYILNLYVFIDGEWIGKYCHFESKKELDAAYSRAAKLVRVGEIPEIAN